MTSWLFSETGGNRKKELVSGPERPANRTGSPPDDPTLPQVNSHFETLLICKSLPESALHTQSKHIDVTREIQQQARNLTLPSEAIGDPTTLEPKPTDPLPVLGEN